MTPGQKTAAILISLIAAMAQFLGCNSGDDVNNGAVESRSQSTQQFDRDGKVPSLQIGAARITVTTPSGFALLGDEAPQVRQQIRQTMPPQNDLHAVFIEQIDLARVLSREAPQLQRVVCVQSDRRLANQVVTPEIFNAVKRGLTGRDVAASIARNKEIVNRHLKGQGIRIDTMTLIDFEDASPDAFVLTGLVKAALTEDDGEYPIRVSAIASRLLNGKIIMAAASSNCDTDDDIAWAKRVALACAMSSR